MTRIVYDSEDQPHPSRLDSYRVWKKKGELDKARLEGYRNEFGGCRYCSGDATVTLKREGETRCVCWTLQKEFKYRKVQELGTAHDKLEWKDFEVWGDSKSKAVLTSAVEEMRRWTKEFDSWLVLAGSVGTGKSHLLHTVDSYLKPWSLYLSVPDLKDLVFEYTGKKELQKLTDLISYHPILLLDDIGAEYTSDYAVSMLRQIIMARYKRWEEYPTVIATNLGPSQLEHYDKRMADRLFDTAKVKDVVFEGVKSWRRYGN